jgi:hypothetical protein
MQRQQLREQKQPTPRWRLSVGEWVALVLNLLLAGISGWLAWFAFFFNLLPGPIPTANYIAGGAALILALGAALTCLLLLIRQTRLAAWFQWLACAGVLGLMVSVFRERAHNDPFQNLLVLGSLLILFLLLVASGRFLRTVDGD